MTILQTLSVAFSFTGQTMPDVALAEMAQELSRHPEQDVLAALKRCRQELKTIKYSDIVDRLPGGHPGPEEAWSCVSRGIRNEALTVVWTDPMREAYGAAAALQDDLVAARVAFKETYQRLVAEARSRGEQPAWSVSRGTDKADQEVQITEAVKAGKLTSEYAHKLLPNFMDSGTALAITKRMNLA